MRRQPGEAEFQNVNNIRIEPGPKKSIPRGYERFQSFSGCVLESRVPPKELQAIYSLNDPQGFGRRTPVDWVPGQQMSAELKMILDFWDIDRLVGRIIICPVGNRNRERLHKFIEWAYAAEAVVNEVSTLWKKVFKR